MSSNGEPTSPSPHQPGDAKRAKRKRAKDGTSCERCKRSHTACDGAFPCSRCRRLGASCVRSATADAPAATPPSPGATPHPASSFSPIYPAPSPSGPSSSASPFAGAPGPSLVAAGAGAPSRGAPEAALGLDASGSTRALRALEAIVAAQARVLEQKDAIILQNREVISGLMAELEALRSGEGVAYRDMDGIMMFDAERSAIISTTWSTVRPRYTFSGLLDEMGDLALELDWGSWHPKCVGTYLIRRISQRMMALLGVGPEVIGKDFYSLIPECLHEALQRLDREYHAAGDKIIPLLPEAPEAFGKHSKVLSLQEKGTIMQSRIDGPFVADFYTQVFIDPVRMASVKIVTRVLTPPRPCKILIPGQLTVQVCVDAPAEKNSADMGEKPVAMPWDASDDYMDSFFIAGPLDFPFEMQI